MTLKRLKTFFFFTFAKYAQFIRNALRSEDIVLKSSGSQFWSWCYVVDCVSALLHIQLKRKISEVYNIADRNSNVSIKELAEMIASLSKQKVIIDIPSNDEKRGYNPVTKSVYNTEKLEALGWGCHKEMKENQL